jgi:integrase
MTIREIKKLKWNGNNELIKVSENLYVEVTKTKKVFKFIVKKEGKQIKSTIEDIDNITLTQAKQIVQKLKSEINNKTFNEAREIIRKNLAKKQSKKDKEIIKKRIIESEKYLIKNLMQEYLKTKLNRREVNRINTYILPLLGDKDARKLKTTDIYKFFEQVKEINNDNKKATQTKNKLETAKKLKYILSGFYKYLLKKHEITNNPILLIDKKDLEKIFGKEQIEHHKAILNLTELQELFTKIDSLKIREETGNTRDISIYTKSLLKFIMLTALRVGTAQKLKWEYIDFKHKVINIPAEITKTNINFRLPLTKETLKILENLKQFNKTQKGLIFKNNKGEEISVNTVNKHLRKLSEGKTTSHGFRSSFSTILKEKGQNYLYIETQLMHAIENNVTKAYTRTDYLEQRRKLLNFWEMLITQKINKPKENKEKNNFLINDNTEEIPF